MLGGCEENPQNAHARSATIAGGGRPPALTEREQTQVALLLRHGLTRERVARAFDVSVRTVARAAAAERARTRPLTLEELLAEFADPFDVASLAYRGPAVPPPRRRVAWQEAAARVAALEAESLDDLGDDAA
jgi:hypothetical protein